MSKKRTVSYLLKRYVFDESAISTVSGALVVVVVGLLIFNYFKQIRSTPQITEEAAQTVNMEAQAADTEQLSPSYYEIKAGDSLWDISQKYYNDPYAWTQVASENKLVDPNIILVGQKLTLPDIPKKEGEILSALSIEAINDSEYVVVANDTLWHIAERAYGTGYKWPDIAKANNIANPDFLLVGQKLILPK